MYRYETHMHTSPVSRCGRATVRESLQFYKDQGYDGVFITNHFLDGNINFDKTRPYEEGIEFYCSDYEEGVKIGKELGLKVFFGAEISYGGTDFLIYGLDKAWYLAHPEIMEMGRREELSFMMENGALVIQAHPYREAHYIDHIRLYPRNVHGVEVINAWRSDSENRMAKIYAENYGLLEFAGTDNHTASNVPRLAGMESEEPVENELDFVKKVLEGKMYTFLEEIPDEKVF